MQVSWRSELRMPVEPQRLLLEVEVEAHACFDPELMNVVHASMPDRSVDFYIENYKVEMGEETPLMNAVLIFDSPSFEEGLEIGRRKLDGILRALSYVTSMKFSYRHAKRLVTWNSGMEERRYSVFKTFKGHGLPYYILEPDFITSALSIWRATSDEPHELAIHWFASAVASPVLEDQFQLFWFALELIASNDKPANRVNDLCAKCGSPLFCEHCGEHPTHKPFNKQAIEALISGIVGNDDASTVSKRLFKIRNMLLHGSTKDQIESSLGEGMEIGLNSLANIAKRAIYNSMLPRLREKGGAPSIQIVALDDYTRKTAIISAELRSGPIEADFKNLKELVIPQMDMIYSKKEQADSKSGQSPV
jgi:hypothetical protein